MKPDRPNLLSGVSDTLYNSRDTSLLWDTAHPQWNRELLCCVHSYSLYSSPQLCTNTCKVTEEFPEKEHCWYIQVWLLSLALGTPPGFQWCTDDTSAVATNCHYYLSGTAKPTAWRETLEFHAAPITRRDSKALLYLSITTSQNHRTAEGGEALCSKQAQLEHAAQGHIQSGFSCLQGRDSTASLGNCSRVQSPWWYLCYLHNNERTHAREMAGWETSVKESSCKGPHRTCRTRQLWEGGMYSLRRWYQNGISWALSGVLSSEKAGEILALYLHPLLVQSVWWFSEVLYSQAALLAVSHAVSSHTEISLLLKTPQELKPSISDTSH